MLEEKCREVNGLGGGKRPPYRGTFIQNPDPCVFAEH